jgi:hypothetical protein
MKLPQILAEPLKNVLSTAENMIHASDARIVESFPTFSPWSAGSKRARASLTVQGAKQTFPLMLDLLAVTGTKVEKPVAIAGFADMSEKQAAAQRLKELCDQYGSDKGNPGHDYHLLYGAILASRDASALLEIGLGTNNVRFVSNMGKDGYPGASLRAFRDFLPNAQIYGADVDRSILFSEERISTYFVDQTDTSSFTALDASIPGELDLIIDDGLHSPNANLATMAFGLSKLKPNGYLVIEDIRPDAVPIWQIIAGAVLPADRYRTHIVAAARAFLFVVQRLS